MTATRLLTFDELRDHGIPFTRRHVYRLEDRGLFPRRVPIGANRVCWVEREIDDYVAGRLSQRGGAKEPPHIPTRKIVP